MRQMQQKFFLIRYHEETLTVIINPLSSASNGTEVFCKKSCEKGTTSTMVVKQCVKCNRNFVQIKFCGKKCGKVVQPH